MGSGTFCLISVDSSFIVFVTAMPRWKTALMIVWLLATAVGAVHVVWTFNDPAHIPAPSHVDIIVNNTAYNYAGGVLSVVVPFGINLLCLLLVASRWFGDEAGKSDRATTQTI
jgi:hypothetical protein